MMGRRGSLPQETAAAHILLGPGTATPVSRKFHNGTSSSRRISCCLPNEYSADPAENL
eukprot:COSAG01_NODE_31623_length_594_cov_1.042424_1_plen_57_part_10